MLAGGGGGGGPRSFPNLKASTASTQVWVQHVPALWMHMTDYGRSWLPHS